ncbi:Thioredoxin-like domain-containing protein [Lutibacter oricola]|uniref:Thioredoxin-like domain-containing protein n=1 Tax=Lutibacter oricola TaxID=762486 RepID=A0A1H3C0Z7_9FLAO|nr:thioredoxin family protein [Lutibacter oricola]SDX47760.1 Thioredoxin-like domain-containing protein [Lutibacter oricola]
MKKVLIVGLVALISVAFVNAQDSVKNAHKVKWEESFTKAERLSKSKNKPMLIFFTGSDWCGPCKMLIEDFFSTEKFSSYKDKYVLYEADYPRNRDLVSASQKKDNSKLQKKYGVSSFPTIVIVDSKGKELDRRKGYNFMRDPSYHFALIEKHIK